MLRALFGIKPAPWPAASGAAQAAAGAVDSLSALIDYGSTQVVHELDANVIALADAWRDAFDKAADLSARQVAFTYHVDMSRREELVYPDITVDPALYDYQEILRHFIARKRRFAPNMLLYLVTAPDSPYAALSADDVRVVRLNVDPNQPMFMRALATYSFASSRAFCADTALLDSDAFLNDSLDPVLGLDFDLAFTYRDVPGLMPLNEGVVFAKCRDPSGIGGFFRCFIATYARLADSPTVQAYYGDIRRWRGGQLTLNAMLNGFEPFSPYRVDRLDGLRLRFLPCDSFNFSFDLGKPPNGSAFNDRWIVHMKGIRKGSLDAVKEAFEAGAEAPCSSKADDLSYSLDSTPPVDYEPAAHLDYERASLTEIADHFKTDKGTIKHGYTALYERHLGSLHGSPVRLLEVGVACGASLKMWSRYFGEQAEIVGLDVRPECAGLCAAYPNIRIDIGDATTWTPDGTFDVIIDDGSHVSLDIVRAFEMLWPRLRSGGLYAIEDLRCTHDPVYTTRAFPSRARDDFDRAHVMRWLDELLRRLDNRSGDVESMVLHPQLALIRKR